MMVPQLHPSCVEVTVDGACGEIETVADIHQGKTGFVEANHFVDVGIGRACATKPHTGCLKPLRDRAPVDLELLGKLVDGGTGLVGRHQAGEFGVGEVLGLLGSCWWCSDGYRLAQIKLAVGAERPQQRWWGRVREESGEDHPVMSRDIGDM